MIKKTGKEFYLNTEIPEDLEKNIRQTIESEKKKIPEGSENIIPFKKKRSVPRMVSGLVAASFICMIAGVNVSPAFAAQLDEVPGLSSIAKVCTIRSYHGTEKNVNMDLEIPEIKYDSSMSKETNKQIKRITDDYVKEAKKEFGEYKKEFFETGGTKEEWANRDMTVSIDYKVHYSTADTLSLELDTSKSWVAAEEEENFYNIDLKNNKKLKLKDVLGDNYVNICDRSIKKQIRERMSEDKDCLFFDADEGGFNSIDKLDAPVKFYLNKKGRVVIVFDKYQIAPGSTGIQEFEIS